MLQEPFVEAGEDCRFQAGTMIGFRYKEDCAPFRIGKDGCNKKGAAIVGSAISESAVSKGIKRVAFDRNGFLYHGRVEALAEAARKGGLDF